MRLTHRQAEALARGILQGAAAAHTAGLVHRDLKPDNVLLAVQGDTVVPKIADFGIAKGLAAGQQGATRAGVAMGTPQFMAPEQIQDARSVDARADVFSLGALLYELFAGSPAFDSEQIVQLFVQINEGRYTPLDQLAPELPGTQVATIHRALTPARETRFANAGEMLAAFTEGRPEPEADRVPWPADFLAGLRVLGPGEPTASDAVSSPTLDPPRPSRKAEVAAPPAQSNTPLAVGVAVGFSGLAVTTLALLVLVAALGWWVVGREPVVALPPAPAAPSPVALAAPAPEPPAPQPAPDPAPATAAPAPVAPSSPRRLEPPPAAPPPAPAAPPDPPAPVAPAAAPVPTEPGAPPGMAVFSVADGTRVKLKAGGRLYKPGEPLTPGTYEMFAEFDPPNLTLAGRLTVAADQRYTLTCNRTRQTCSG
jgi:serine/threonine-protein kinase